MSRMRTTVAISALFAAGAANADVPNVVADIAPVHSLVSRVMEGVGTPFLLIPAGASPHEYSLRPSEAAALEGGDVVFWIGADLTPWLDRSVDTLAEDAHVISLLGAGNSELLDFREGALFEAHSHDEHDDHDDHAHDDHDADKDHAHDDHDHEHEEHAHDDDHDHDHGEEHAETDGDHEEHAHDDHDHDKDHAEKDGGHDHGHAHGGHDPHAWLSPTNASAWLNVIAEELAEHDPENAEVYRLNAAAGGEELAALSEEISTSFEGLRDVGFVVFHDAYQYFEDAFDIPASGAISISDASDPSPARIAEIQERVKDESISCILSEPQFNPAMVATVMDGTEASTGVIDPLGVELETGASLYPALIRNMASVIAECLR